MKLLTIEAVSRDATKTFDCIGELCEGLIWVKKNGREFHIRPDGTPAYQRRFDLATDFLDGVAFVFEGKEMFCINPDGTRVD